MTPQQVARFMRDRMEHRRWLYRAAIAPAIHAACGPEHASADRHGSWRISDIVIAEFEAMHAGRIEWVERYRAWRLM